MEHKGIHNCTNHLSRYRIRAMARKFLFNRRKKAEPFDAEPRHIQQGKRATVTFYGSPLRGLLLLHIAFFGFFLTLLSFLPFTLKATWRLAKLAGHVEARRSATHARDRTRREDDYIDI